MLHAAHSLPDIAPDFRATSEWLPFALPLPDIPVQGTMASLPVVRGGKNGKEVDAVLLHTTQATRPGHDKRTWRRSIRNTTAHLILDSHSGAQ